MIADIGKRALKLLANYYENPSAKESVFAQLQEWLEDSATNTNRVVKTIAATIYMNEGNHKDAFRVLKDPSNLEQ